MESLNVPTHIQAKLPEDWTAQDVVDAGEEGLTAIDGIGPGYARRMVEAATAIVAATQSHEITPDSPETPEEPTDDATAEPVTETVSGFEGDPTTGAAHQKEPEEEPQPPPKFVEIKLVGAETAVVGLHSMWRGESRRVFYQHYVRAAANHPDAFLVRLDASEPWGKQLSL